MESPAAVLTVAEIVALQATALQANRCGAPGGEPSLCDISKSRTVPVLADAAIPCEPAPAPSACQESPVTGVAGVSSGEPLAQRFSRAATESLKRLSRCDISKSRTVPVLAGAAISCEPAPAPSARQESPVTGVAGASSGEPPATDLEAQQLDGEFVAQMHPSVGGANAHAEPEQSPASQSTATSSTEHASADAQRADLDGLPPWSYPKRLGRLYTAMQNAGHVLSLGAVAGEGIPLQYAVLLLRVSMFLAFGICTYGLTECVLDESINRGGVRVDGVHPYPWWIWVAFAPSHIAMLMLLYTSHKYTVIPMYEVNKGFHVFGKKVCYKTWLRIAALGTTLANCDLSADAAALGSFVKASECFDQDGIWKRFVEHANGPDIAEVTGALPLTSWVLLAWSGFFIDIVFTLLRATPLNPRSVDYETASTEREAVQTEYPTVFKQKQNHGCAFVALASSNDDHMGSQSDRRYARNKFCQQRPKTPNGDYIPNGDFGYFSHAEHLMTEGLYRIVFKGLLSNWLQLSAQLSILRLRQFMLPNLSRQYVGQSYLSFGLSVMVLVYRSIDAATCFVHGRKMCKQARADLDATKEADHDGTLKEEIAKGNKRVRMMYLVQSVLVICVFLCVLVVLLSLLRMSAYLRCGNDVLKIDFSCTPSAKILNMTGPG